MVTRRPAKFLAGHYVLLEIDSKNFKFTQLNGAFFRTLGWFSNGFRFQNGTKNL